MNVEGNFYPNVDYEACFRAGIHVLGCGPAYAQAVAEFALGLAIDLARGISREDRAFREGRERYVSAGNDDAILLRGSSIGLVGYGNLGRALHRLLRPFDATIRAFDPWLPASTLRDAGLVPATLDEVLAESQVVFVLATVTAESERLLGPRELDLLPEGARLVLVSRAAVFDFDALLERVAAGRFLAAIDVWPQEPMPADTRPGRSTAWCCRPTGRAASRRRSSRSATWCSTTSTRSARPAAGTDAGRGARARRPLPQPAGDLSASPCVTDAEATLTVCPRRSCSTATACWSTPTPASSRPGRPGRRHAASIRRR